MSKDRVQEETIHHFLRMSVQFQRMFMFESRRFGPESAGPDGKPCHERLKHSERLLLFAVEDTEKQYPDGITVGDLGRLLRVRTPSIATPLNHLERMGFVVRVQDSDDRRVMHVRITETGRAFLAHSKEMFYDKTRHLLEYLGEEKSNQLISLLEDLFTYLQTKRTKEREKTENGQNGR